MKRVIWVIVGLLLCVLFVSLAGYQVTDVEAQAGPPTEGTGLLQIPDPAPFALQDPANRRDTVAGSQALQQAQASPLSLIGEAANSLPGQFHEPAWYGPAECGVPESGPFGRDVEILLNDRHFEVAPAWHNQSALPCADNVSGRSQPSSDIAAAALNSSKIAAVWRENDGQSLYYSIWNDGDARGVWDEVARNGPFDNWYETYPYRFTDDNYQSIHSADVNGDGIDELLARSDRYGIQIYTFDVNTGAWVILSDSGPFTPPWPEHFNSADNYTTFHSGDVDGDGRDELLVRLDSGVEIWEFDGAGWLRVLSKGPFANGYPQGCGGCIFDEDNWATIHLADVDGDDIDELLGRMDQGMEIWDFSGSSWTKKEAEVRPFPNGLDQDCSGCVFDRDNWATIHSADIDGDGQDELLARLDTGMQAWKYVGDTWQEVASDSLFSNWWEPGYYKFYDDNYPSVHSGDVDGDGVEEVVARSDEYGMVAYRYDAAIEGWAMVAQNGPLSVPTAPGYFDGDNLGTFHSGDLDGDRRDEILFRDDYGMVAWRVSLAPGAWGNDEPDDHDEGFVGGLMAEGNPAVLAIGGDRWEVYARNGGGIQYSAWDGSSLFTEPEDVPGVGGAAAAASDPVVISRGPGRTALFYRDSLGDVWLTEREATEWRAEPLSLQGQVWQTYLPLLIRPGPAADPVPAQQGAEAANTSADQPLPTMSVLSRNENHLAVFIVDQFGKLWVREWTTLNESDWSDTSWVKLMQGVAIERPAVASRHSNHMSVAVRNSAGNAYLINWNASDGWGDPTLIDDTVTFSGPLSLAVPGTREIVLAGPDGDGYIQSMHWRAGEGWQATAIGPDVGDQQQVLTTVVRRTGDVMVLARTAERGLTWHYSSQNQLLEEHLRTLEPPLAAKYRNQVLARVDNRSYYLALDKAADNWRIEATDLAGDVQQSSLTLTKHAYVAGKPLSLVARDLDHDGSDELLVATYSSSTKVQLSVVDLHVVSPTLALAMDAVVSLAETFPESVVDFSLTAGDLDGDGRPAEAALVFLYGPKTTVDAWAMVYQYVPGEPPELQGRSATFQQLEDYDQGSANWAWELEAATGRLGAGADQLALTFSGERNCPSCDWMGGYTNIYTVEEQQGGDLVFKFAHSHVVELWGDPDEFTGSAGNLYRSAVATGDMDADGYEEVAVWYVDGVFVIDPNDLTEEEDPTISETWLTPKWPGHQDHYWQSPRSLAVDDIDQDGRAEIAAAAVLTYPPTGKLGLIPAMIELLSDGQLQVTGYGRPDDNDPDLVNRYGTVLLGDMDGDGLVSRLVGCEDVSDYSVVAVLNGLPRPYESGEAIFDSMGSYSSEFGIGSSEEKGTTFNVGASLTVGFEQEINVPLLGTKIGEVRASVTQDFMATAGMSEESAELVTFADNYEFQDASEGLVVYSVLGSRCYYYELFSLLEPDKRTRAMACTRPDSEYTNVMSLELWHSAATQASAGASWVDVGHRAPDGTRTNDLAKPGNYPAVLPIDDYLLLFTFPEKRIAPQGGELQQTWSATEASEHARTRVKEIETNTTISVGATVGSVTTDAAATFGFGWNSSKTTSWSSSIMFAGGYSWPAHEGLPYYVVPYVYQATAKTQAGATYAYWVMDYYVPAIGS